MIKMLKNLLNKKKSIKFKIYLFNVVVFLLILLQINMVFGRNVNVPGFIKNDKITGGEGWVNYNFNQNNQISIRSNVDIDIQMNINQQLSYRNLNFNITNSQNLTIKISVERIPESMRNMGINRGQNRYRNRWNAYVKIEFNATVENIEISADIGEQYDVYEEDTWVISNTLNDWELIDTSSESSALSTSLSDTSGTIYLTILSPSLNIWFIVLIVGISAVAISLVIAFTKTEYREFLLNRIMPNTQGIHRLTMEDVLENENRSKIIDLIMDKPGIHFNELLRQTGLSPGNLVWHLSILEEYKVIGKKNVGQYLIYFPLYDTNPMNNIDIQLAKSKITLQILDLIEKKPGIYGNVIAKELDLDHKTVKYHLDKLIEANLVKVEKDGRKNLLYPVTGALKELKIDKDNILTGEPEKNNGFHV